MPWNDYPLQSISIPADHGPTGPYIYIGPDDPIAQAAGEDASIVFHFGTHNSAFLIGVQDEMTPHDDGHFQILAVSDEALNTIALVDMDFAPFFGLATLTFGAQRAGVATNLVGETVILEDLAGGIFLRPYESGLGTSAGLTVDVGHKNIPQLVANNTGVLLSASRAGDLVLNSAQGNVSLTAANGAINAANPNFVGTLSGNVPNTTVTTLTPSAALYNTGSMWTPGGSVVTVAEAGEYEVGITTRYPTSPTGTRYVRISVNGTEYMSLVVTAVASFNTTVQLIEKIPLAAGDQVSFAVQQTSGGTAALVANSKCWVSRTLQA